MGMNYMHSIAGLDPHSAAERAVNVIGLGYDLCNDIRLSACKSRLVEIDNINTRDLVFPAGVVVSDVPNSIKCDKGERTRFHSDVLPFNQVLHHITNINMRISVSTVYDALFSFCPGNTYM